MSESTENPVHPGAATAQVPDPAADPADPPPVAAADGAAALLQHRAAALALDPAKVKVATIPARIAWRNVNRGVPAVLALQSDPNANLPAKCDWTSISSAISLARAFWQATVLFDAAVPAAKEPYGDVSARVYEGRQLAIAAVKLLASRGDVSHAQLAAILDGRGDYDACADVIACADVLTKANSTDQVGAGRLVAMVADAENLRARIRPAGAKGGRGQAPEVAAAGDLRDRVFTLLALAYTEVRRAALCNWADDAGEHVPTLGQLRW